MKKREHEHRVELDRLTNVSFANELKVSYLLFLNG